LLQIKNKKYIEDYLSFFVDLFNKGIKNGEFIEHDSRTNAVALMSALDGSLIYMVIDRKIQLKATADGFFKLFVDSVIFS
jgi:hypothetical protein